MLVFSYNCPESESSFFQAFEYKNGGSLSWGKEETHKEVIETPRKTSTSSILEMEKKPMLDKLVLVLSRGYEKP